MDNFSHQVGREEHMRALRVVSLTTTTGLHGMLGLYIGMRVRLTKKIYAPEIVQEATGEGGTGVGKRTGGWGRVE